MDVFWEVGGSRVSSASLSDSVEAHVVLGASRAGVSDFVTVRVVKDIAWASDILYVSKTLDFFILEGDTEDLVISFSPDARSGSSFRWYLVEIVFSDGSSWIMEQLSPPRLRIE